MLGGELEQLAAMPHSRGKLAVAEEIAFEHCGMTGERDTDLTLDNGQERLRVLQLADDARRATVC
jgi:hypothetical protein